MILLIMAAGSGSRYGKLKQFDQIGPKGQFLMEYGIFDAIKNDFNHIVVITKEENQKFLKDYFSELLPNHVKFNVIVQDNKHLPENITNKYHRIKPWGTAHAVWCAKNYIDDSFAIINADDFYGFNAFKNAKIFMKNNSSENTYGLVTYKLKDTLSDFGTVSRGVCEVKDENLVSINEHLKIIKGDDSIVDLDKNVEINKNSFVSMNFWICKKKFFNHLENYLINEIQNIKNIDSDEIYLPFAAQELLSKNIIEIKVIDSESNWFGVTYKNDKKLSVKKLNKLTESGNYPMDLWKDL